MRVVGVAHDQVRRDGPLARFERERPSLARDPFDFDAGAVGDTHLVAEGRHRVDDGAHPAGRDVLAVRRREVADGLRVVDAEFEVHVAHQVV